jgi:hypothetical protein
MSIRNSYKRHVLWSQETISVLGSHEFSGQESEPPSSSSLIPLSLGWCLPTGFETPIPYFYVLYFVVLLVHRQIRDDEACKAKYGKDWDKVG